MHVELGISRMNILRIKNYEIPKNNIFFVRSQSARSPLDNSISDAGDASLNKHVKGFFQKFIFPVKYPASFWSVPQNARNTNIRSNSM